jgi:hypothetical protein
VWWGLSSLPILPGAGSLYGQFTIPSSSLEINGQR